MSNTGSATGNRVAGKRLLGLYLFLSAGCALAGLPEPLTLEYALSLAEENHPRVRQSASLLQEARASERIAAAENDTRVQIEARLRYSDPLINFENSNIREDHRLGLLLDKTLYDFGREAARTQAAKSRVQSREALYRESRQQQRLEIMRRYFDVVLADFEFVRYNEEMAVVFVELEKLRERHALGQLSEIDLLEQEAEYRRVRSLQVAAQNRQRLARARLAYAMNRPGELPATVARPTSLPQVERPLPDLEALQEQALRQNNRLQALREAIAAARERLAGAQAQDNPVLIGGAQANAYSRARAGYDRWRVELRLEVPLAEGERVDAAVARERARLYRLQAELQDRVEQIRQEILELWLQLENLQTKRRQMQAESEYRELYLDRSRALYDMEVTTDLGDAMVRITEAERDALLTDFNIALVWEQLQVLAGGTLAEGKKESQ